MIRPVRYLWTILGAGALASCGVQYPRQVTYELGNSYSESKALLDRHFAGQRANFGWTSNGVKTRSMEVRSNVETHYLYEQWAPDIGTHAAFSGQLLKKGSGSSFTVEETSTTRILYDTPRAVTGNKLGQLKRIDQWVGENLEVTSRTVGVDESRGAMYPPEKGRLGPRFPGDS